MGCTAGGLEAAVEAAPDGATVLVLPRLVLRDGVWRSRRFVMLPSFGLSLWIGCRRDSSALVSRRVAVGAF